MLFEEFDDDTHHEMNFAVGERSSKTLSELDYPET